jgi:hypothetical protein
MKSVYPEKQIQPRPRERNQEAYGHDPQIVQDTLEKSHGSSLRPSVRIVELPDVGDQVTCTGKNPELPLPIGEGIGCM